MQPNSASPNRPFVICDPACGTGGFLLASHEFIRRQRLDKAELRYLNTEQPLFRAAREVAFDDNQIPSEYRVLNAYGVCDDPEQLLSLYDFEADPRRFFISFVCMRKAHQSPDGGWRLHKWGYVGKQKPQCEYVYDEPEITQVYT
jgi:AraC-like DNA-binding protein